ncbi:hypothetical protein PspLS_05006 [Pyricularia sp. CBS 133598]|nr:hypothetical protein PspLS_05006 [Pyricularia sp. CBS 133598]
MDSASSAGKRKSSDTYVCKRCNVPGRGSYQSRHWLAQCPTNLDPSFDTVPPRLRCSLCGAVGKHLLTLCPKNTDPKSINQQRILAGVSSKDHRRESRRGRHKLRLSSIISSSKGEDGYSRRGDRGRSRGRSRVRDYECNLDHTRECSRSRSPRSRAQKGRYQSRRRDRSVMDRSRRSSPQHPRYVDDSKHEGLVEWKVDYGLMNEDRARMMQYGASRKSRNSKRTSSTQTEKNTGNEYAVRTSEDEEARRNTTVSPPETHPVNDWCTSPESPDWQSGVLHMNMALRSRRPQQPDETATADRILESVEQYITAEFDRESSDSKSPGPQDAPIVEPVIGTKHPLGSYSAAARSFVLRCGLRNPWVNYTKRTRALDLWDKKEQTLGASRARSIRHRYV